MNDARTILEQRIGERLARKIFQLRGNHSEIHISETDLAELCAGAAHLGIVGATIPVGELRPDIRSMLERKPLMLEVQK